MILLTMPERKILLTLYDKRAKNFSEITAVAKIPAIDCFKIIQRLLIKKFINYERQKYSLNIEKFEEIKSLLQQKEQKLILAEQITQSAIFDQSDKFKLKEVCCNNFELNILRNHFSEIERLIEKFARRGTSDLSSSDEKFYIFWGEQNEFQFYNNLKKRYIA